MSGCRMPFGSSSASYGLPSLSLSFETQESLKTAMYVGVSSGNSSSQNESNERMNCRSEIKQVRSYWSETGLRTNHAQEVLGDPRSASCAGANVAPRRR